MRKCEGVRLDELPWMPSPSPGVERRMLDRVGDEVARATSVVRYAPGSKFPSHTHGAGEEYLVLDGVFEDEHGAYPPGTYVRNPWGSAHAPASREGCVIFVKLRQMHAHDQEQVVLRPESMRWDSNERFQTQALYQFEDELIRLEKWPADHRVARVSEGGLEVLVLEGRLDWGGCSYPARSWLRIAPAQEGHPIWEARTEEGCTLWLKSGHLQRWLEP